MSVPGHVVIPSVYNYLFPLPLHVSSAFNKYLYIGTMVFKALLSGKVAQAFIPEVLFKLGF